MRNLRIEETGFDPEKITGNGNKFLVGNGYMGVRGTPEEAKKAQCAAVNLAGIYDRVGNGWREPLNAPNGLFTVVTAGGAACGLTNAAPLSHNVSLDIDRAVLSRNTRFDNVSITAERFASMAQPHLLAMRYTASAEKDGTITVTTGIDGDVWDLNGPHYDSVLCEQSGDCVTALATAHESGDLVFVAECCRVICAARCEQTVAVGDREIMRRLSAGLKAGESLTIEKFVAVFTSRDGASMSDAVALAENAGRAGYAAALAAHEDEWARIWKNARFELEGDDEAMLALNYSIYHLESIAPRHSKSLSIPARGLSGQTYKGAVFWDTEMFILDLFLYTDPAVAKTLLRYRVDTLSGAMEKAKAYGEDGAFYAWESQEGGFDACSDYNVTDVFTGRPMRTYFKDKQIHISAAVAYGIMRYTRLTGDRSLLEEGGAKAIIECARFYYSLLVKRLGSDYYELRDVIGPDEYHERVNNNGYTNRMAKLTLESAAKILLGDEALSEEARAQLAGQYDCVQLAALFCDAANKLFIPKPDGETGVIEQFDGYFRLEDVSVETVRSRLLDPKEYWGGAYGVASDTQVIKQADVVTWLTLFPEDTTDSVKLANWLYYEPRTEHGSSLSACMYALLACRCGMPEKAYPLFMKSASADLSGGGKEWAGLVYIGGTHPAAAGGAYMTAVNGFCGLSFESGEPRLSPRLPEKWQRACFRFHFGGGLYEATVTREGATVTRLSV